MIKICCSLLIQVIFESFPVSSSGNIELAKIFFFPTGYTIEQSFTWLFHIPTLIALAWFCKSRIFFILTHLWQCAPILWRCIVLGICSEIATLVGMMVIKPLAPFFPLWLGFFITMLCLCSVLFIKKHYHSLSIGDAILIGAAQGIAFLPGISRLGITLVVAQWLGIAPRISFLFSWMIASIPMTLASVYGLYSISVNCLTYDFWLCLVAAIIVAYITIRACYALVVSNKLWVFAFYLLFLFLLSFFFL